MVLPAVIMVLFLGTQVLAIQSGRVKLINLAAESARALARGEDLSMVDALVSEVQSDLSTKVRYLDLSVCVEVVEIRKLGWLTGITIAEEQCARKSGL